MKFKPLVLGPPGPWEDGGESCQRSFSLTVGELRIGRLVEMDCKEGHLWGKGKKWYLSMPHRQASRAYKTREAALRCISGSGPSNRTKMTGVKAQRGCQ